MKSIIALDIGIKRTGIAKSDSLGIAIKPYKTIATIFLIDELIAIESQFGIAVLIIGLPHNIDGASKDTEELIKQKSQEIQKKFPQIKIEFVNEAYSSREAEARLKEQGIKLNQNNKGLIDQEAAVILLEQYFNELGSG